MYVSDIMSRDLLTMPVDAPVSEALRAAEHRDVHHVLVVQPGMLAGVLCACELRELPTGDSLSGHMRREPHTIAPGATLAEAARDFLESGLSCFPVCDGGELVGVVTRSDMLQRAPDHVASLLENFRCTFCGSTRHVRALSRDPSLSVCLECSDRTVPADTLLYEEGQKD